jgi:hypothetical protein
MLIGLFPHGSTRHQPLAAIFQTLPGASFIVNGAAPAAKIFAGRISPARAAFHLETAAKLLKSLERGLAVLSWRLAV